MTTESTIIKDYDPIEQEILRHSLFEHDKYAKDLSFIYSIDHPKRIAVQEEMNRMKKKQVRKPDNKNTYENE